MAKKKEKLSIDEEMLMWTSYRYCIGRKTYVIGLADYIAQKYYPLLSEERMEFTAKDIRSSILDCLRWSPVDFSYEGTVSYEARLPIEDLLACFKENNIDSPEKILKIKSISVYQEHYGDNQPKLFKIDYYTTPDSRNYKSESDIDDLIPWANLASCFDKKNYKLVHVKYDGKEEDVVAFESWSHDWKKEDENSIYYTYWPWHWRKGYMCVDEFLKKGNHAGHINPDFIVSVEDYKEENNK